MTTADIKNNFYLKLVLPFPLPDQVESANSIIDEHHPAPDQFKLFFIHQLIPKMEMLYLVSNLETRTNNIMEGFNSYLAKNYRCHMNVWLFLAKFRQEESIFFIKLSQLENGATFSAQKSQYARRTQMILHAISQRRLEDGQLHFLKQIGRIFYMTR